MANDNDLSVSFNPHKIEKKNSNLLVDMVCGRTKYDLPVIYVSRTKQNRIPIDVNRLSYLLKGIAHVFVQEDASINHLLSKKCNNQNEINGTIGVYYPSQKMGHKRCRYIEGNRPEKLMEKIVDYVMQYSNLQNLDLILTWQGVRSSILNDILDRTNEKCNNAINDKQAAQNEVKSVYSVFGQEIDELQDRIKELTNRNLVLEEENARLSAKVTTKKIKQYYFKEMK